MAFDQATRNRLARFVAEARAMLSQEFTRQLQHEYGMDPNSGDVTGLERLTALDDTRRETARILRETMDYYLAGMDSSEKNRQETLDRIVREQAFTVLNRLCALRMAEGRGLLIESIGQGYQSKGFQLYARLAGAALGETGEAYRCYLFSIFDEFAVDLPALFDRFGPEGRLFPREDTLIKLLGLMNEPEIEWLWVEDETIGWIYQYFNSKEERQKMRAESQAPRNSRELAVRNQFFTPRYVVEFLTDNTLGRIWYEMNKGDTRLAESCRYLVRRPNEIFLKEGEGVPELEQVQADFSQEELIKQPVYIPHRLLKDPREIKMLDPACGSMHFGLYAFDLFEKIYEEAWELEERLGEDALWRLADLDSLHDTYPDKVAFLRDVPRLIIERNIHGIDIDPRAVQIAGLSLWLRAQKSWQAQSMLQAQRPSIRRSNIVCAEPMPGDRKMLEEFLATLREDRLEALIQKALHVPAGRRVRSTKAMSDALANLVRTVWQEMNLAGEAGSLLKIEEILRESITQLRKASEEKSPLFRVLEYGMQYKDGESKGNSSNSNGRDFWSYADILVLGALGEYAEQTENDGGYRRHLFAGDAAQGFSFIELSRQRFDVTLMNPPFGAFPQNSDNYINNLYDTCRGDMYPAFVVRASQFSTFVGAITNRTGFQLQGLANWRRDTFIKSKRLTLLADLGSEVLDALVETAAYVLDDLVGQDSIALNLLKIPVEKQPQELSELTENIIKRTKLVSNIFIFNVSSLIFLPGSPIAYNITKGLLNAFKKDSRIESNGFIIRTTSPNYDDFRFLKLRWEVDANLIGRDKRWSPLAKGGDYQPYYGDIELLADWDETRGTFRGFIGSVHRPLERPACADLFFQPGITWSGRTLSRFSPRILPEGCIFSSKGPYAGGVDNDILLSKLGIFMSSSFQAFLELFVQAADATSSASAARDYQVGTIRNLPKPYLTQQDNLKIREYVTDIVGLLIALQSKSETNSWFLPGYKAVSSIRQLDDIFAQQYSTTISRILTITNEIDKIVFAGYGLSVEDKHFIANVLGPHPLEYEAQVSDEVKKNIVKDLNKSTSEVITNAGIKGINGRFITVKSYYADRHLEVISHTYKVNPKIVITEFTKNYLNGKNLTEITVKLLSFGIGIVFGRWDINYVVGTVHTSKHPNPFSPLLACPPGMLQNDQGLPATQNDIQADYPLRISWSGIIVDDEAHLEDIEWRIRDVLHIIWREHAEAIEQEACKILDVCSLREYFQKTELFFADHLKHYSKSRRQAPIYWPLSTQSNSYILWLYYHRISDQTLFTCINDFVDPKLKQISEEAVQIRQKSSRTSSEEKELVQLTDFEQELKDFRAELLRVAAFWKPNLNDGVQITAAPLWKLFQHKPWQKKLKGTWEKLEAGEYDWAHLAYSIWPERVREKCKTDKSLAIAHDLEHLYVEMKSPPKKKSVNKKKTDEVSFFGIQDEE
jgi:hypothetical protein